MNETKTAIDHNLFPISKEEAIASMFLFGERFENGNESSCIANYKWNGRTIVEFNGYEIDSAVTVTEFPQLYRRGSEGNYGCIQNEETKSKRIAMKESPVYKAVIFAIQKHNGQKRKGTELPYIYHPLEAMQILMDNGCSEPVLIAGVLHDVIEDTKTTPAEIINLFGEEIYNIVAAETEDKSKTWKERKQATIDHLSGASLEAKLVCCADKLSNLRSMFFDYVSVGEKLWERFNAGKEDIKWYYSGIVHCLSDLSDYEMYKELKSLLGNIAF